MTAHPMLYGDPDLKLFLESESLVAEVKGHWHTIGFVVLGYLFSFKDP
jgi:sorting nexin-1/2